MWTTDGSMTYTIPPLRDRNQGLGGGVSSCLVFVIRPQSLQLFSWHRWAVLSPDMALNMYHLIQSSQQEIGIVLPIVQILKAGAEGLHNLPKITQPVNSGAST